MLGGITVMRAADMHQQLARGAPAELNARAPAVPVRLVAGLRIDDDTAAASRRRIHVEEAARCDGRAR